MIPKLGQKYAVVDRDRVRGPFYVVGVRGGLVALAAIAAPNSKAMRTWRANEHAEFMHRDRESWSVDHAEPWTDEHRKTAKRQRIIRELAAKMTEMALEKWSDEQLEALVDVVVKRELLPTVPTDSSRCSVQGQHCGDLACAKFHGISPSQDEKTKANR